MQLVAHPGYVWSQREPRGLRLPCRGSEELSPGAGPIAAIIDLLFDLAKRRG